MKNKSDEALIKLARCYHQDAFAILAERHQAMVRGVIIKMGLYHVAEDLVQETFLQAYVSLPSLRDPARFRSWLYGIAQNVARTHVYQDSINMFSLDTLRGEVDTVINEVTPEDHAEAVDLSSYLHQAINQLSAKNRAAILHVYFQELSLQETADVLDVSLTAVKSRLHKARKQLNQALGFLYQDELDLEREKTMIKLQVVDVVKQVTDYPLPHVVILWDEAGQRMLLWWMSQPEAEAIALQIAKPNQKGPHVPFNFFNHLLTATETMVESVQIGKPDETVPHQVNVVLKHKDGVQDVTAWLVHGIILALHANRPIYATEAFMQKHSTSISQTTSKPTGRGAALIVQEIMAFEQYHREWKQKMQPIIQDMNSTQGQTMRDNVQQSKQDLVDFVFGDADAEILRRWEGKSFIERV
ncbi:MAG: bifunctional nuclease domain-containing protein [Chloroflexota bacterium]